MNEVLFHILTDKVGLTEEQAKWTMMLSDKHAIWIANQIKSNPALFPSAGKEFQKIVAWKKKNPLVNIKKLTYQEVLETIEKNKNSPFIIQEGSLQNQRVVATCHGSEFKWVEIETIPECTEEGIAMKNCLKDSGYNYIGRSNNPYGLKSQRLFSLRNMFNKPVVTLHIVANKIMEYRGKANKPAGEQYAKYFKFLQEQAGLIKISKVSAYNWSLSNDLDLETFHEMLEQITMEYREEGLSREEGDRRIAKLIEDGKRCKLKVDISPDLLENVEVIQDEASLEYEYDENGSIIC